MRYYEFRLVEGYPQAQAAFAQVADAASVQKTIADFKQLVSRNQIKDVNQKNIDYWIKQGWDKFNSFVNQAAAVPSKSQVVKKKLTGQSITLVDNATWFIIIPIDKESSCFHGKDSNWCTTKIHQGHFENYFYKNDITLIYCFNKSTGGMWAIATHKKLDKMELFDQKDNKLTPEQFTAQTGLDPDELRSIAMGDTHQPKIQANRDKWKASVELTYELLDKLPQGTRSPEIEKELLYNKSQPECLMYIAKVGSPYGPESIDGKDFPIGIQIAAMTQNEHDIRDLLARIRNPVEAVQLAAVKLSGATVKYIINKGITPSEAVQLAAVSNFSSALDNIITAGIKPSERVQLAAVSKKGHLLRYIIDAGIKPSEAVQKAAVTNHGDAIRYIVKSGITPSETVQKLAVSDYSIAIGYIVKSGITPSEDVQEAAVTKDGDAIKDIIEAGIKPSERVQLAAVTSDPQMLANIIYQAKIKPSEAVQIAAVEQDGATIYFIIHLAKITPSEAVQLAAVSNPNGATAITYLTDAGFKLSNAVKQAAGIA